MPDRDYYLTESFATQRAAYKEHLKKMFAMLGDSAEVAAKNADTVLDFETALAKASRSRTDLRDPNKNYNKYTVAKLVEENPNTPWKQYLADSGMGDISYAVVGQPEFYTALDKLVKDRPLSDWKTYLRWQVLHNAAPFLHKEVELENFNFFGKALSGQEVQEPRWKRSYKIIDHSMGEALGQLYVEKHFPPQAKARMTELVANLKEVFKDHLEKLDWMSDETKNKSSS